MKKFDPDIIPTKNDLWEAGILGFQMLPTTEEVLDDLLQDLPAKAVKEFEKYLNINRTDVEKLNKIRAILIKHNQYKPRHAHAISEALYYESK